jgi:hypothetical protein
VKARAVTLLCLLALAICGLVPGRARAAFGFEPGAAGFGVADGGPVTLAGSHPDKLEIELGFNRDSSGYPEADVKDLILELPPGLIENPRSPAICSQAAFTTPRSSPHESSRSGESCPDASQVGTVAVESAAGVRTFGLFNLVPPPGAPSRIGYNAFGAPVSFVPEVRQAGGEFGITLRAEALTQAYDTRSLDIVLWGTPWSAGHDGERGNCLNEADPAAPYGGCPVSLVGQSHGAWAYLTMPSECSAPPSFTARADSWAQPGTFVSATAQLPAALEDCAGLGFSAVASAVPAGQSVSSPTGLSFSLEASQVGLVSPTARFASRIRRAVVALPEGMTINPSVGAGLGACSEAQFAAESPSSAPGDGCPNPSKVGVGTVETPLVEGALSGSLFIATPFANPFGAPYALYFVAKSPQRGFIVKVAGRLEADPVSGRLVATFEDLPQLPYTRLKIDFREGQRAPLVTPPACGKYTSQIALSPWSDPGTSIVQSSSFTLSKGIAEGGACPSGGAPFAPGASAGSINANAGSSTSFYLRLTRSDIDQEITSYSAVLPPGLLGSIAGIPFCGDEAIARASSRSGAEELRDPSCPAASAIGHTYSGYGVGLAPAYAAGGFYLAGPYHGAPLSVVAINPAIVGPFDLGTVVIRSAIVIDPHTAQVTIDSSASDPIPHIFAGIPLRLRDVRVYVDRPDFMVNPTSCSPFSIVSRLTGSDAPFLDPRSATHTATVPYQVSNCGSLRFAPGFRLSLVGPTKRGGYPRLQAVLTPRAGDANLAAAAVTLPPSLFLAQNNIKDICTRVQFAAGACPPRSVVGTARAVTPLLGQPLEGAVFLRSSDNPLPDLVADLRGPGGLRILLEGRIDSRRGGIRASFEGLPDAAVSRFEMTIFGGRKRGILTNSEQLCRRPQLADARFVAKNNAAVALKPKLAIRCPKKKGKGRSRR